MVFKLNGDFTVQSKSISFANMSEHEFEELFSKVINVLLRFIPTTAEELTEQMERAQTVVDFS